MLYDFVTIDHMKGTPLYRQLYDGLRDAILTGKLNPGQRLLSLREAAAFLHISKITVEEAYRRLCVEGYVQSRPKSGYVVRDTVPRQTRPPMRPVDEPDVPYQYDLGTGSVDTTVSDIKIWQYHLRKALAHRKAILSYGEPQGEAVLRKELSLYTYTARGVETDAGRIVIGAGIQPLLSLLCGMLGGGGEILLQEPALPQATRIFEDFGYTVSMFDSSVSLTDSRTPLCFAMPTLCRNDAPYRDGLLDWLSAGQERFMIEDDYNGELHYATDSIPALQGHDPDRIIYLGSFSKLLLPSVRISYMVLPPSLIARYGSKVASYNQTASKIEQLALARYIHEGELERHLRKLRKQYRLKSKAMEQSFATIFGDSISLRLVESQLCFYLYPKLQERFRSDDGDDSTRRFVESALDAGVRILPAPAQEKGTGLAAGFCGIDVDEIPLAVGKLRRAWERFLV